MPQELSHVWAWWIDLDKTRSTGMDACQITYTEIANWSKLLNIKVTPLEVRCLIGIDTLAAVSRSKSRETARKAARNK